MARRARDARPRLLVVEDDPAIREALVPTLTDDYRATFTTCQAEALQVLEAERFDLALVDLLLPIEPRGLARGTEAGIGVLRAIRARSITQGDTRRALPVVVMTAHADSPRLTAALFADHGANDFVGKPFGKEELLTKLRRALLGQGAVAPSGERGTAEIRLAFDDVEGRVHVESLPPFDGGLFELLDALRGPFMADVDARRASETFTFVTTAALVKRFGVGEEAFRRRVLRARKQLKDALERDLHRTISEHDVIESAPWKGYRLNPLLVRVVGRSELTGPDDSAPGR